MSAEKSVGYISGISILMRQGKCTEGEDSNLIFDDFKKDGV